MSLLIKVIHLILHFALKYLGFDEFQNLLTKQAPIEGYTEWLDNIIDKCVLQVINVYFDVITCSNQRLRLY